MAALVETMFSVREKPWHGLGTVVEQAPDSQTALEISGLNWNVIQKNLMTTDGNSEIPGFKANIRDIDNSVLGIVTDRYKVVQNSEAFAFTDALLGEGVSYETAGSLQGGRRTWILARLPHQYIINGDEITPYMVFIDELIPESDSMSSQQKRNISKLREDMKHRYFDAPDLQDVGNNAYRFINAVSDFATHARPLRERSNYRESLFARTVDGNPMIDKAYQLVMAA